ncbi:response regulator [Paraflavitalea speifideaquila]|uniref:response regulator n=1 Tax=Paraflavitalea speifideaquila TaxID=3076558 RepID=UPI0028E6383E|nr:response regulator [Paraflavitalea speifideiaquila]
MANNIHILLVEDEDNLGYILSEYLQMKGFRVTRALNGKTGLEKLQAVLYDLCLLDIMLPDIDGFAIAKQIHEAGITTPFIF